MGSSTGELRSCTTPLRRGRAGRGGRTIRSTQDRDLDEPRNRRDPRATSRCSLRAWLRRGRGRRSRGPARRRCSRLRTEKDPSRRNRDARPSTRETVPRRYPHKRPRRRSPPVEHRSRVAGCNARPAADQRPPRWRVKSRAVRRSARAGLGRGAAFSTTTSHQRATCGPHRCERRRTRGHVRRGGGRARDGHGRIARLGTYCARRVTKEQEERRERESKFERAIHRRGRSTQSELSHWLRAATTRERRQPARRAWEGPDGRIPRSCIASRPTAPSKRRRFGARGAIARTGTSADRSALS